MGLFNYFKKNFSSNFNENQFDEVLITDILLERMLKADGIYSLEEEEKESDRDSLSEFVIYQELTEVRNFQFQDSLPDTVRLNSQ